MFGCERNMQVILYDEDEMQCFGGYLSGVTTAAPYELDITSIEDSNQRTIRKIPDTTAKMTVVLHHKIIELDPTIMRRIAKHNLDKENESLLKEIESHKKEIDDLKELYKTLQERLQTISDIGSDIWEHGTEYEEKSDDWEF